MLVQHDFGVWCPKFRPQGSKNWSKLYRFLAIFTNLDQFWGHDPKFWVPIFSKYEATHFPLSNKLKSSPVSSKLWKLDHVK